MKRQHRILPALLALVLGLAAPTWARGHHHAGPKGKRLIISLDSSWSQQERAQLARELGLDSVEELDDIDVVIVQLADDQVQPAEAKIRRHAHVQDIEEDFYTNWLKMDGPQSFADVPLPSLGALMGQLPKLSAARAPGSGVPAAPAQPAAPAPGLIEGEIPWGIARVGAPKLWDKNDPSTLGAGVKVAVIDTGIDCGHPDLDCSFSEGANFVDPQADPMDDQGHGTHVAGTIAAKWDGRGVVGVAPAARVIPVKVLDETGGGSLSNIVRGINWAASSGAQVINMSLGAPQGSASLERAIERALAKGVTIVAAAGNEGPNNAPSYPGAYPGVIAVAASDINGAVPDFSSRGDYVSFVAPGVDVISTAPGGKYAQHSGTSMASPHVAGLAALAISMGADGPDAVAQALANSAKRLCTQDACFPASTQGVGMPDASRLR